MEYTDKSLGKNYDVIYEKFHVKVDTDIFKTSDRYSSINRAKKEYDTEKGVLFYFI